MSKKNELDQYYTSVPYAKYCYELVKDKIKESLNYNYIEPCCGTGSFYNLFKDINYSFGYDLEPKIENKNIQQQDFLLLNELQNNNPAIVLSNPPFGKNSSLAIKFFNKCASFENVKYICFIVPKTFMKFSVQNKLSMDFQLLYNEISPPKSFILHNEEYDVPCTFQIWERTETPRIPQIIPSTSTLFEFVSKSDANCAIRRVGGRSGLLLDGTEHNTNSTYFIRMLCDEDKWNAIFTDKDYLDELNLIRNSTAGVRSISKPELIYLIEKYYRM